MTSIVLTGGRGFLGSHLWESLARDHAVHALMRTGSAVSAAKGELEIPSDPEFAIERVVSLHPSAIVHLAAEYPSDRSGSSIMRAISTNIGLGSLLLEAAQRCGAVFVTAGSYWQHVGGAKYRAADFYAATKQSLSDMASYYRSGLGVTARELTLFDTYGPGDTRSKIIPYLMNACLEGTIATLRIPNALIDLTYVSDVVSAFQLALARDSDFPSNCVITAGSPLRIDDLVGEVERVTHRDLRVRWTGEVLPNVMVEPWEVGGRLPGWDAQVDLTSGLEATWDWCQRVAAEDQRMNESPNDD